MLSEIRDRLEGLAARVGLGALPLPVAVSAVALAVVVVAWAAVRWAPPPGPAVVSEEPAREGEAADPTRGDADAVPASVTVHVVGAVRRPGVYRLRPGARGTDAIEAAGGALGNADLAALNLARLVADGEQLSVPAQGGAPPAARAPGGGVSSPAPAAGAKVDLNRATAEQLDALPGVGPSTAAKIVQEREANGPYRSVDDLMRVPGIGPKKLDGLRDLVTTG